MGERARVVVVQDGARLHYAVPAALHREGLLEKVFCDWYSRPGSVMRGAGRVMRALGKGSGQRMLDRYSAELNGARVETSFALTVRAGRLRKRITNDQAFYRAASALTGDWVKRVGLGNGNVLMGFVRNVDPGLVRWAKERGVMTVGDQIIAPYAVEKREAAVQRERFPEYVVEGAGVEGEDSIEEVERETWAGLDRITCASEYVRDGLIAQGIDGGRVTVNPYPVGLSDFGFVERRGRAGAITVGFVGAVNLRKGTPYFWEVARRFDPAKVKFVMVGPVGVSARAVEKYRGAVELAGGVARSAIAGWMGRFDVYLFPSTCEGSAGSAVEAMATGLPVITSENSGTLVEEGVSGFVRKYEDVEGLAAAVERLAGDAELRWKMGAAARARVEDFGPARFGRTMAEMLERMMTCREKGGGGAA